MSKQLKDLQKPIIGLSPMDGITDAPYRIMTNLKSKPDITYTEFVNVIGITRGSDTLYQSLIYSDLERPILGQVFGAEPEYFYHAAKIICELGFDGVDINMGCPAKSVSGRGAGAALIQTPDLAKEIIDATLKGVEDWYETGELTGLQGRTAEYIAELKTKRKQLDEQFNVEFKTYPDGNERSLLPVSVKTRIGYSHEVVEEWIPFLAKQNINWIALHGRTLKQLYGGSADWDVLAKAVRVSDKPILVNGDIKSQADIDTVLNLTKASGVLIGRATYGNPWFFDHIEPTMQDRVKALIDHVKLHIAIKGDSAFVQLRKHMGWYVSGFREASNIRVELMKANSIGEIEGTLNRFGLLNAN